MPYLIKTYPNVYTTEHNTIDSFMWSSLTVWGRVFGLDANGAAETGLIPFMDLANHKLRAVGDTTWDTNVFELDAKAPLTVGNELEISYGDDKPTLSFLLHYGFLTAATEGDFVTFSATVGTLTDEVDQMKGTGPLPSSSPELLAHVGPDGYLSAEFLTSCGKAFQVSKAVATTTTTAAGATPASPSSDVLCTGIRIVLDTLTQQEFATSAEEDLVYTGRSDVSGETRTAVAARLRFKQILARVEAGARASLTHKGCAGGWPDADESLLAHRLHEPSILLGGQIARSLSLLNVQVQCI